MARWCHMVVVLSIVSMVTLLPLVTSSAGQVWCNTDSTLQPHMSREIITKKECPTESKSSESPPGPPMDLQVETHLKEITFEDLTLSFNISWLAPDDSSLKYLKGFQLEVREIGGSWHQCLLFELSSAKGMKQDQTKKQLRYHYDCLTNMKHTSRNFSVHVTSLPKPQDPVLHPEVSRQFIIIPTLPGSNGSSARWSPELLSVHNDSCTGAVQVTFPQAPAHYHFKTYEVLVIQSETIGNKKVVTETKVKLTEKNSTVMTTIEGLEPGHYHVMVSPLDPHRNIPHKCFCKRLIRKGQYECASCVLTTSPGFTIYKNDAACYMTAPSNNGKVIISIIGVTVGMVLCVILAGTVMFYIKRRKVDHQGNRLVDTMEHSVVSERNNNNEEPPSEEGVSTRKRVLLLDIGGYKLHKYVVDRLTNYLVVKGQCDVQSAHNCVPDIHGDPVAWLNAEMNKSDKIVLVHSEGAHREMLAIFDPKYALEVGPTTKLFLIGFRLLAKCRSIEDENGWLAKLVIVRFPYTDVYKYPLPVFTTERQYTLTDEMGHFLSCVHNRKMRPMCETDSELETAIDNMVVHVHKYPDWFSNCTERPVTHCAVHMAHQHGDDTSLPGDTGSNSNRYLSTSRRVATENMWIAPDSGSQHSSICSEQITQSIQRINSEFNNGDELRLDNMSLQSMTSHSESTTQQKVLRLSTHSQDSALINGINV